VAVIAALAIVLAAVPAEIAVRADDHAYVQGDIVTSASAHASEGDDTATATGAQVQASITSRVPIGERWAVIARADSLPQSSALVSATDVDVWRSGEVLLGPSFHVARLTPRVSLGLAAEAGVAFSLADGISFVGTPKIALAGAYLRDSQTDAHVYMQCGRYDPVSADLVCGIGAQLPALSDITGFRIALIAPVRDPQQSGRLMVGFTVRAFRVGQ
jgi:hypothetical protein